MDWCGESRFCRYSCLMILVPCLVALVTWFTLRSLQGWWVFAGINDKRPGIVFVAAMIGLAAVVISEFLACQRQIAVRKLARRMSLCFSSEPEPSLKMQIKHLVIGKVSQLSVIVEIVLMPSERCSSFVLGMLRIVSGWRRNRRTGPFMSGYRAGSVSGGFCLVS